MGTQNYGFGAVGNLATVELKRKQLQEQIDSTKSIDERRKLGQFATPFELAKEIIAYGLTLQKSNEISFFEPALGTGSFYSALLCEMGNTEKRLKNATAIEIDEQFFSAAQSLWGDSGLRLINADFTTTECFTAPNFLISNPPYVRHHYINQAQKHILNERVKNETGMSLSGLAGLYCYFLLLAHKWLAPGAVCGWLIPSEFMDVNYGSAIKQYLTDKVRLLRIHRYNPENCKFDDALVSSCVVWFKNEAPTENYDVEFTYGGTHHHPQIRKIISKNNLSSQRKWTRFTADSIETAVQETVAPTLGDFFAIKRGIATGDNDFFILSKEQILEQGLDMELFIPILPSPRYLKRSEVLRDNLGYPELETQYFLLNCTLCESELREKYPAVWRYIISGEETTAKKYLCKNRKVWYQQEQRTPTPFLCSYMGRGQNGDSAPFRFILNHSDAIATNSYLMLYPKGVLREAIENNPAITTKVWNMLKTITTKDLESEGRVYGGGLKKIEPKELSNVKCHQLAELLSTNLVQ